MNTNKLNTLTLSALIIGPVMGSGIILLPPLLYDIIQNYSLFIWVIISLLGLAFALIFGKLAILFKGEGGVSLATKSALGKKYQYLTSFYLILAVFFGPVAVVLIAADFMQLYFVSTNKVFLALIIYIFTYILLLFKIDIIGKIMLFVTSIITIILLISSINILLNVDKFIFTLPIFNTKDIGYSFLLVFWAIVGWEVIGNYSNDVKSSKTITNAVLFSAIIVGLVYILVSGAISFGSFEEKNIKSFELIWLIEPLFGNFSKIILLSISLLLCVGTLILFVGGVARLIASLKFNKLLSSHLTTGSPIGALSALGLIHLIVLFLVYKNIFNKAILVSFADGFFIANAMIGLITAIIIFKNGILKFMAFVLLAIFFAILQFSNIYILFVIFILFLYTYYKKEKIDY